MKGGKAGEQSMARRPPEIVPPKKEEPEEPETPKSCPRRAVSGVLDFLDQTWLQTLQYIVFLFAFQSLTGTIRKPSEFYFDKYLTDTFIANAFDVDHNSFVTVRRVADVWEWQKNVLAPGLFSQSAAGEVWPDGGLGWVEFPKVGLGNTIGGR